MDAMAERAIRSIKDLTPPPAEFRSFPPLSEAVNHDSPCYAEGAAWRRPSGRSMNLQNLPTILENLILLTPGCIGMST